MSRARDMANGVTTFAPLASPTFTGTVAGVTATHVGLGNVTNESKATMFTSPDFTGTVDLTGTTVSLDNDEISVAKIDGLSSAEYFYATGNSSTGHQTLTTIYATVPLDAVMDEGGIYEAGVFTPTGAGTYLLGGVTLIYDLDAGYTVYMKLTGAGSAPSREFQEQCSVSNHTWQLPFSIMYTASSSSDTYSLQTKISSSDTGNAYLSRTNTHFYGLKLA